VSARFVDITSLGGTIANISMNNQKGGYPVPPKVVADAGMSGYVPSFKIIPSLTYLDVKMTNIGYGYTTEPTVVIKNRSPNGGGGAVAKAILGIPGKDGQSGPGGYTSNSVSAAVSAWNAVPGNPIRTEQDFTVPGGGYTTQPGQTGSILGVAFVSYGSGYIGEVDIEFLPGIQDQGKANIVPATAECTIVHSNAYGPPSIIPYAVDGNGIDAKFNVSVNSGLYVTGSTGAFKPMDVLVIPHTIDGIHSGAFTKSTGITHLTFENLARCWEIGDYAFSGCTGLKMVWIPPSIQRIGDSAFENCTGLEYVIFKGFTGPALGKNVFENSGGSTGTQFYIWQNHGATPSYGGGTGWYANNYLGGTGCVHNLTTQLLEMEPSGPQGLSDLGKILPGSTGAASGVTGHSVDCDSSGNVYYSDSNGSLYVVDIDGTQTTLLDEYDVLELAIMNDILFYIDTTGGLWRQKLPWPLDPAVPYPQILIASIPGATKITHDSYNNIFISCENDLKIYKTDNGGTVSVYRTLINNTPIGGMACDSLGRLAVSYPSLGRIYFYSNVDNAPRQLVINKVISPYGLVYDNANNLYFTGSDHTAKTGISIVSANLRNVSTYAGGFYINGGITLNKKTSSLFFNNGDYLCYVPVTNTDIPLNLFNALASHDYAKILTEATKTPGQIIELSVADVISINSTLADDAQVPLPDTNPVSFVCPNLDASITIPETPPNTSISYATSLGKGVTHIVNIGNDQFTATFNNTVPPTITFINQYGGGKGGPYAPLPGEPVTLSVGKAFKTYSGVEIVLYSIGMTVFQVVTGDGFIPGVQGKPPPVCKPKRQGVDYSQYLSGDPSSCSLQEVQGRHPR
jgi:hypothetical protein